MNAEIETQITAAAAEAESILGESFVLNGQKYAGVFGASTVTDVPNAAGGYTRKALVTLVATRAQFAADPAAKQTLTRLSPRIDYLVDAVDTHDATQYTFALVRNGG